MYHEKLHNSRHFIKFGTFRQSCFFSRGPCRLILFLLFNIFIFRQHIGIISHVWYIYFIFQNKSQFTLMLLFLDLQSCTKLVGTHALIIIIAFVIKMYVYKMTCMIQYPCSKHASSPSLPHQAMLVYTCLSFIPSALSSTTLILGSGEQSFYTKCPNSFVQDCIQRLKKIKYQNQKMSRKIQTRCRNCVIFAGNNV